MRPRILITIVTENSRSDFSIVKGRQMADGMPSPGPTKKQIELAYKAIDNICTASAIKKAVRSARKQEARAR